VRWEGDRKGRFAVAPGEKGPTIYRADADGTLRFFGPDWKECLETRCKRVRMGEWHDDPKCRTCVRNCRARLGSQEEAMRVAEAMERRRTEA
jgi:hypothetical protein